MKKTFLSVLALSLFISTVSFADLLQLQNAQSTPLERLVGETNPTKVKVMVAKSAIEGATGSGKTLTLVGAGLRSKKVAIWFDIYGTQFFAENASVISKSTDAMSSLGNAGVVALRLSFVYGVNTKQITKAFTESLNSNLSSDEMASDDIQEFLNNTVGNSGNMPNGSNLNIVGYTKDGSEFIAYENNGNLITQKAKSAGFIKKIFSIWLGNIDADDTSLTNLKPKLLGM